jgi:hypothetical protein
MRVITKDMEHINRYIKCPHCRQSSYLSTIQTVNKDKTDLSDLMSIFGDEE